MRRPKGQMTVRQLAINAGITEQTMRKNIKFLIHIKSVRDDIYSLIRDIEINMPLRHTDGMLIAKQAQTKEAY